MPAAAFALPTELRQPEAEVSRLQVELARVEGRRVLLENQLDALNLKVENAKAAPRGVRRDLELRELLAQSKARSDELERIAAEVRWRSAPLKNARTQLVAACDHVDLQKLPAAERSETERACTEARTQLASRADTGQLGRLRPVSADPLDGPRELREKADLLRDSTDKLHREAARIARRIDTVERQRHLRERSNALDDDWFSEAISNRHQSRVTSTLSLPKDASGGAANKATDSNLAPNGAAAPQSPSQATPTTAPAPGGTTNRNSNGDTSGGAEPFRGDTSLSTLLDPATLSELRRTDSGDDVDAQIRALRRAQGELEHLAQEMDKRAKVLNDRADELKHRK
jgi:hypothetical protein